MPICGGSDFAQSEKLWLELITDWELSTRKRLISTSSRDSVADDERRTRKRSGMEGSFLGRAGLAAADYRVETGYGENFWCEVMASGFRDVRLRTFIILLR